MTFKNQAASANKDNDGGEVTLLGELVMQHTDFALAAGLAHDASKGDVLAKMAKDRSDAEAARGVSAKLLGAIGADSSEKAIAKLTGERTQLDELVKAILGDNVKPEEATVENAVKKLANDRKASETAQAKAMIEKAAADGKTAGEKAFGIFEKLGMAALEAHLDALVPHATLVKAKAGEGPTQKSDPAGTKPTGASEEVVLSDEDKRFCEKHGINEDDFLKARKDEIAYANELKRKRDS